MSCTGIFSYKLFKCQILDVVLSFHVVVLLFIDVVLTFIDDE